jgi:hypothetical protein
MPKRFRLVHPKQSAAPRSKQEHDRRGPGAGTTVYKHLHKARRHPGGRREDADVDDPLLLLARQASEDGQAARAFTHPTTLTQEDQQLLDAAVQRILRPSEQGGIKRTRSGEKAVHDIRDMLTRLSNQVAQSKAESKETIDGLHANVAEALEKWDAADALLTALRKEKAELQRQLTREQARPKLPQTRKENVQRSVCW